MKKLLLSIFLGTTVTFSYGQAKNHFTVKDSDVITFISASQYDPFNTRDISKPFLITSRDYSQTKIDETVLKKPGTVEILCSRTPTVQAKLNSVMVFCGDVADDPKQ